MAVHADSPSLRGKRMAGISGDNEVLDNKRCFGSFGGGNKINGVKNPNDKIQIPKLTGEIS